MTYYSADHPGTPILHQDGINAEGLFVTVDNINAELATMIIPSSTTGEIYQYHAMSMSGKVDELNKKHHNHTSK